MANKKSSTGKEKQRFEQEAEAPPMGIIGEFWYFLLHNKKWWITPIVLVLLAFGFIIIAGGSAAAPFIYTLF